MKKGILVAQIASMALLSCVLCAESQPICEKASLQDTSTEETVRDGHASEQPFLDEIHGEWVLLLHYPTRTKMTDITISPSKKVQSKNTDVCADMSISLTEDGSLVMANPQIRIDVVLDSRGHHLKGMATVQGVRGPIPCSAFKIIPEGKQE
ncbi:MAG TPA: hypothetical protein ENN34_00550 [Deltaproteobacteria bacterium]|nr:hypothetical protein [Deltaproteobacteria bacterium]